MAEKETVAVELPAPAGWKKFIPKDGTPRRNAVIFISPTGEEIKNRKHLVRFLRSYPGGPSPSEFDWGYGDTLRRSVRIREKVKATESPEEDPPKKRQAKLNLSKGEQDEHTDEEEVDDVPISEKTHAQAPEISIVDAEMKDGEDEDGSLEVKAESAAGTINENNSTELVVEDNKAIEEMEVKEADADQDSTKIQEDPPVLSLPESPKVENSIASNQQNLEMEEARKDAPSLSEENSAVKEIQVDSKATPRVVTEPNEEDLRDEEEVKDRNLFKNNHSYAQKI